LQAAAVDAGHVEQIVDEPGQPSGLPARDVQMAGHMGRHFALFLGRVLEQLQRELDGEQGILQFVRGDGEELVPRFDRLLHALVGGPVVGVRVVGEQTERGLPVRRRKLSTVNTETSFPTGSVAGDDYPGIAGRLGGEARHFVRGAENGFVGRGAISQQSLAGGEIDTTAGSGRSSRMSPSQPR
jgi:hypothetical protein